jgi:hypothetical protein
VGLLYKDHQDGQTSDLLSSPEIKRRCQKAGKDIRLIFDLQMNNVAELCSYISFLSLSSVQNTLINSR